MMSDEQRPQPRENGAPIIGPSQDMVLGLYYTTIERDGMPGQGMSFADIDEVELALSQASSTCTPRSRRASSISTKKA